LSEPKIVEVRELPPEDLRQLYAGLMSADPPIPRGRDFRPLVLEMRDELGALRGGLLGETVWTWLSVGVIWVSPELRGSGQGARLLDAAEGLAIARGCTHARLDTFDWQARGFYERRGYAVYGQLDGFPTGHTQYHLCKSLSLGSHGAS
jgi:ribosomal protein S18 acetylase RimI-like enzyme